MATRTRAPRVKRPEDIAFGRRLKMIREEKGVTQGVVARWLGISNKTVSQYESGGAAFPSRRLPLLADKLGVSVSDFYDSVDKSLAYENAEDREWLGYLGRRISMLPPGLVRESYKERLREFADSEAHFLKRLSEEGIGK